MWIQELQLCGHITKFLSIMVTLTHPSAPQGSNPAAHKRPLALMQTSARPLWRTQEPVHFLDSLTIHKLHILPCNKPFLSEGFDSYTQRNCFDPCLDMAVIDLEACLMTRCELIIHVLCCMRITRDDMTYTADSSLLMFKKQQQPDIWKNTQPLWPASFFFQMFVFPQI